MINLELNKNQIEKNAKICRERNIIVPTFEQMRNPEKIPQKIKDELKTIGLWDVHPRNLFRISWHNDPLKKGGGFGKVNYLVLPQELTGVKAKIVALVGKWFPTGAHKVGASFGCLAPALITGQFDPVFTKAVWPSTGNYCRGGAYVSVLLACSSIAILPEEMSKERFEWLSRIAGEVIATPGCESNVKEIFDKCNELLKTRTDIKIFNQFDQPGNHLWHYSITGPAMEEVLAIELPKGSHYRGVVLSSGSSGTLGCGDYLKEKFPYSKLAVSEALQCPTILNNGFGGHRIEGIGDKHIPWIHNVKNTDMAMAIDDNLTMRILQLFNENEGKKYLKKKKVDEKIINKLDLFGISSIANMLSAIKFARYYELSENDIVLTVFTDSMELYDSRVKELNEKTDGYDGYKAAEDYGALMSFSTDNIQELTYPDRKRIHNLKYYTWVEQQGKDIKELNSQWYDFDDYWNSIHEKEKEIDKLIKEFNDKVGLI